jgi:hypothetical protein
MCGYYGWDANPQRRLNNFTDNLISLEEVERRGLQITNLNSKGQRRK